MFVTLYKSDSLCEYCAQKKWDPYIKTFSCIATYDATNLVYKDWAKHYITGVALWEELCKKLNKQRQRGA